MNTQGSTQHTAAQWFVVSTKPRQEQTALENLQRQAYQAYLPRLNVQKRRRDKWHSVSEPLFPGYVFVQLTLGEDNTAPIRSTIGVKGLVRFGSYTPSLDGSLISWFKQNEEQQETTTKPSDLFIPGQPVTIIGGPFAGLEAIYNTPKSSDRATILITVLGQPNQVHCHWHNISPAV